MDALEVPVYGAGEWPAIPHYGALLVNKPAGWTSFSVIRRLRRIFRGAKMGHAGTLDPMATGLLIILMGKATKSMLAFQALPKHYTGCIRLGEVTPSHDDETPVSGRVDASGVSSEAIEAALQAHTGTFDQIPPMYSAVKIAGERLYKKARRGERVARKPNRITVTRFVATDRTDSDVSFEVDCSKGTYVRALARDVGRTLGVGAHLVSLVRVGIGPYTASDAWTIDALSRANHDH